MSVCILFINAKDKQCRKCAQYSINTESLSICNSNPQHLVSSTTTP